MVFLYGFMLLAMRCKRIVAEPAHPVPGRDT
jgi:hypothetical protein